MTFETIIKIVLSAFIGFIALNSFFRYHFSSERFITFALIIFLIILFIFKDEANILILGIILFSLILVTFIIRIIYDNKKDYGYLLLNVNKEEYNVIIEEINHLAEESAINKENIIFRDKYPHILYIKKEPKKRVRQFIRLLDTYIAKKKKTLNMNIYWHFIVALTLIAMVWRF